MRALIGLLHHSICSHHGRDAARTLVTLRICPMIKTDITLLPRGATPCNATSAPGACRHRNPAATRD